MTGQDIFVVPASSAQERLWLLDRLEPGSSAFNLPASVRLVGHVDAEALRRSLRAIVRRHEALRTVFGEEGGQVVQVILPEVDFDLSVVDLAGMNGERAELEAEIASREALLPFDLARGPLLRATLLRLDFGEHVLLVTLHHIVADGWSLGVLIREMSAFYTAFVERRPVALPVLPVQYADYAFWQRERLQGAALSGQLAYWKDRLASLTVGEALPPDRPWTDRGPVGRASSASLERTLPPELSEALRALARRERVTSFILLLTVFKVLLHRLSGQDEIVVGTAVAGRNRSETKDLIGLFLNTLVLRTALAGDPPFIEALGRVHDTVAQALANQDVPFEKLIEVLRPRRSRTPFFQVFFNMLNFPRGEFEAPDLKAEYLPAAESGAKFDLTVYAADSQEGIRFRWVYDADLFARDRMEEILTQYLLLLRQIADSAGERISAPTLVTRHAAEVLPIVDAPLDDEWYGPVHAALVRHADANPGRIAIVDRGGAWTYAELEARSNRLAHHLLAQGIEQGEIVAVWGYRCRSLVVALLGVMKAGAAFTILDPAHPAPRLVACLQIAAPRAWVALGEAGKVPAAVEEVLAILPLRCRVGFATAFDVRGDGLPADTLDGDPGILLGPDDVAVVAFTSGSTGAPKGILGRHGPLSHFLPWQTERFGFGNADRFSLLSGLSHDPLQRDVFTSLWVGGTICVPDPDRMGEPSWLGQWMEREGVSVSHLTPAMGRLITDTSPAGLQLPALRWAFFVGEALTWGDEARLRRLAPAVRSVNFYGSTETQRAVGHYILPIEDRAVAEDFGVLPLGRGMPDVQLLVLNRAGCLAGIGERGEIHVRSPHLARGYLGRLELTAERFVRNPFGGGENDRMYRTGDLGRYLPDGNVEFLGRLDDQVQIRGYRVEPAEVQQILIRHSGVRQAVVMARGEEQRDRRLVAYVVAVGAVAPSAGELRAFLLRWLPDYMMPSAFVFLQALPLLPNGKLDRNALPSPASAEVGEAEAALRTPTEEILAGIWRSILNLDRVGAEDDFFALGGHSLLATQLISRCQEVFGIEVPLRMVFEAPMLSDQAERLAALLSGGLIAPPIRAVSRAGGLPLSFAQERLWFIDQLEPGNPRFNLPAAVRLTGKLDVAAFAATLGEVARRHEVLRTVFRRLEGGPVQEVLSAIPIQLPMVDLGTLPVAGRDAELRHRMSEEAVRPFDLAAGPLLHTLLLRLGEGEHVAVLTTHHVASDRWSSSILFRETAALYGAFAERRPSPLPELPVQYADYSAWQRSWLVGEILEEQLRYWERQLASAPPSPRLAAEAAWLGHRFRQGAGMASGTLSVELLAGLGAISRRKGATLFMTLTAICETLLHFYTGQEDIVVGTDFANRTRVETEGLIGFFVNQLVLRCDLSGEPSFPEILRRVREVTLAAYAHHDLPFQKVVERLRPERSAERSPLFQVKINLHNVPTARVEVSGLALQMLEVERGAAQLDLILNFVETPQGLATRIEYDVSRIESATIARLLRHLEVLASHLVNDPEANLAVLRQAVDRADKEERAKVKRELESAALGAPGRISRKPAIAMAGEVRR